MAEKTALANEASYVVDTELISSSPSESLSDRNEDKTTLKTAKDGHTTLIPQPSDDPRDPLNWTWLKKHAVLLTLLPGCLLSDGILTYGSTMFQQQAMTWHMTPLDTSHSINGGIFMQGPGGLLAVAFCQRYGRLPTLFWSQFLSLIVTLGAAGASGYGGFTACRTLQGFFAAAPQVIGLSMIHDMFFFHERARKINIWAFCFLLGPYFMPFISSWIALALDWRNNFWILAGFCAFSVLTIVVFGDETLYDRHGAEKAVAAGGFGSRLKLLLGVTGAKTTSGRPSIWTTQKDQYAMIIKPYVMLPCFGFIMPLTMWVSTKTSSPTLLLLRPFGIETRANNIHRQ